MVVRPPDAVTVERLAGPEALSQRVGELGRAVADGVPAGVVPVLVGVLAGAMPFLADLARAMRCQVEVDMLGLTRFGGGGKVALAVDVSTPLAGRHVVLVEDMVDTGLTLRSVLAQLAARDVADMRVVTLLDRRARRLVDVPVDQAAFVVGDEFVVGYGLDWEGRYRNLPSLWAVTDLTAFADDLPPLEAEGERTDG